jgi:hypothetical protein
MCRGVIHQAIIQSRPRSLIQLRNHFFTEGRNPEASDQLVARPLPKHRTTQTE